MMEAIIGFLRAALPWGAVGLLWAVFFAKNAGKEKKEEQPDNYGTEGVCLGMCFGTAIATAVGNHTGIRTQTGDDLHRLFCLHTSGEGLSEVPRRSMHRTTRGTGRACSRKPRLRRTSSQTVRACLPSAMSRKAPFEYWIAGLYKSGEVPVGLKLFIFPESDWALFSTKGPMSGSLQSLNTQARQGRYPTEGQKYMENGNAMLEVCSPSDMQNPNYECGT